MQQKKLSRDCVDAIHFYHGYMVVPRGRTDTNEIVYYAGMDVIVMAAISTYMNVSADVVSCKCF